MRKKEVLLIAGLLSLTCLLAAGAPKKPCTDCKPCQTCKTREDVVDAVRQGGRPPHELWFVLWTMPGGAATWFMTEGEAETFLAAQSDAPVAGPFHAVLNGYAQ